MYECEWLELPPPLPLQQEIGFAPWTICWSLFLMGISGKGYSGENAKEIRELLDLHNRNVRERGRDWGWGESHGG